MDLKKLLLIFLLTLLIVNSINAVDEKYNIEGKIYFKNEKTIYIYLVDIETVKKPFTGIEKIVVRPNSNDLEIGFLNFKFYKIPKGIYGIRCYQDLNENGKLDRGAFGPKEPWQLSWYCKVKSVIPTFEDFCFLLDYDKTDISLILK